MFQFTGSPSRPWRPALLGAFACLLYVGNPSSARSQVPASDGTTTPNAPVFKADTDATDLQDGIRNGSLFYATAPLSEEALSHLDGTPTEASVTVPLTVDRVNNRLYVQALLNGHKLRLLLDTAGGPSVGLDEAAAHSGELAGKVSTQIGGVQGKEPATLGLSKSLTLGKLTLRQIATFVSQDKPPFCDGTLGTQVFERYRVMLDFAAKTMTLTRGGVPTPLPGGAVLSVPFDDQDGYIFVPVLILGQPGRALLDSGSDINALSAETAKAAAAHLSPADAKTVTLDTQIGAGETDRKFNLVALGTPVPIFVNTAQAVPEFSTTSQIGLSYIDDVLNASFDTHLAAKIGFPFLLQFQRVIIDYPRHTLILQYPTRNTFVKVALSPTDHTKHWPGYKWLQRGYAWIEVPDGKSAPSPPTPVTPSQATVAQTTSTTTVTTKDGTTTTVIAKDGMTTLTNTQGLNVIVSPPDNGSITVTTNGQKSVYPFPPGSTVKVTNDGVVLILPPGAIMKEGSDGSVIVTTGSPAK